MSKDLSRFLSLVLRHKPENANIKLDKNGWVDVRELIKGLATKGYITNLEELKCIVSDNDKQRFSFNGDYTKIKANQGHSLKVDLQLKKQIPPTILYHGTSENNLQSILKHGLSKQKRHHVHLSSDIETALKVGARHGKVVILEIDCKWMFLDNFIFYISDNNVWLTEFVPTKYIKIKV